MQDYGARFYDPVIGRFNVIDRFAEKYVDMAPYHYGANNPIKNIDINGDSVNVHSMQNSDITNKTHYVNTMINDLQSQTGLAISVDVIGQMNYSKDPLTGDPIVDVQMGPGNTLVESGSLEARNLMTSAIDNKTTAYVQ